MFSLDSPVKLLWTYKRYEAGTGGGFGKGGLPEGSLLLLFKRQSCSESTSDGKRAYDNRATGADFSFCCLWKAAPFLSDLSTDLKKKTFQFQGAPGGNLALRGSEAGV